jgi:hypothetical protein
VKLGRLLRGAPSAAEASQPRRRQRAARPDGPKTIVPIVDAPSTPLARDLDAARERLRRAIPPVNDDLE